MKLVGFFNLKAIGGQIAALVLVSIVALHAIITTAFLLTRPDRAAPPPDGEHQLAAAAQLLGSADEAERPRLMSDIAHSFPKLDIRTLPRGAGLAEPDSDEHGLRRRLGHGYRIVAVAPDGGPRRVGIELPDGAMISARIGPREHPAWFWAGPWVMTLLFAVISVTLLGLWAASALTAPLSSFARAAESFSLDGDAPPLAERGPEEIRFLARALNRMRERITGLIADRTRMLAAISHDLRTPITRLRLRAEFIHDDSLRSRMLADLDQMRSMLESVLSFLRNDRRLESATLVDVASTLEVIADQFADMGYKVRYEGPARAAAMARPDDLHRGITNLVDNATRFGAEVTIRLTARPDGLVIEVEDDGPGISDARKREVLEPFVRGDDARNMDAATGFGLGLSIARAIALAHGGELTLHDRQPRGLIVRMRLPPWHGERRPAA